MRKIRLLNHINCFTTKQYLPKYTDKFYRYSRYNMDNMDILYILLILKIYLRVYFKKISFPGHCYGASEIWISSRFLRRNAQKKFKVQKRHKSMRKILIYTLHADTPNIL